MRTGWVVCILGLMLVMPVSMSLADDAHGENHICFKQIDSNGDDAVTMEEFEKVFKPAGDLFKKMDLDQDGTISHDEYEEYWYNNE
jgi:Ca2+-binding EF-hand superfamily protein